MSIARRLRTAVLFLVVSGSIAFAAGAVLSRAIRVVDRLNGFPRRLFTPTDDPHLPYVLTPGIDISMRGVHVAVNDTRCSLPPRERASSSSTSCTRTRPGTG